MEVTLPSGFIADGVTTEQTKGSHPSIKKIELKNGDTLVAVYIENMKANRTVCPVISGFRMQKVLHPRPNSVVVYDYYESGKIPRANIID